MGMGFVPWPIAALTAGKRLPFWLVAVPVVIATVAAGLVRLPFVLWREHLPRRDDFR